MDDFQEMNAIYAEKFSHFVKPARQAMQVARLPLDALIEISCIDLYSTLQLFMADGLEIFVLGGVI
jgi:2-iminobutanoate/2-iminopropanoate deaminase